MGVGLGTQAIMIESRLKDDCLYVSVAHFKVGNKIAEHEGQVH